VEYFILGSNIEHLDLPESDEVAEKIVGDGRSDFLEIRHVSPNYGMCHVGTSVETVEGRTKTAEHPEVCHLAVRQNTGSSLARAKTGKSVFQN
jgi:hypothetical protein